MTPIAPFRAALETVFVVASLPAPDRTTIDVEKPISEWANRDAIVSSLVGNYARFVDIAVGTEDDDYLLWEAVEVATTYGDPAIDLDAELVHRAPYPRRRRLRYSKRERHGLIEKAAADVNNGTPALVVCVDPEDGTAAKQSLFDHRVRNCEHVRRNYEAERLRSLQVDDELKFGGLFDRSGLGCAMRQNLLPDISVGSFTTDAAGRAYPSMSDSLRKRPNLTAAGNEALCQEETSKNLGHIGSTRTKSKTVITCDLCAQAFAHV